MKGKKYAQDKDKKEKHPKKLFFHHFGQLFWAQNGHPELDPRAYVLAKVGAVIRKKREGESKREIETQRELVMAQKCTQIMGQARLCLSLHLVSLWRISGWRIGAFKRIWRIFILKLF